MCGICGEIRFEGQTADVGAVAAMSPPMCDRGPDGGGLLLRDRVALGHRRLKIIDLSNAADQPMTDPLLGLSIAYNGAIYNYPDLRKQLQGKGYTFFSTGDTEVILKAYHAWGPDCVHRFNGMFAFAITERDTGRTFLARDRLGIKPLYHAKTDGGLRFASTLPALLAPAPGSAAGSAPGSGGIDTTIDPVALNFYMSFHSIVPPPYTILKGVRKLAPATTLTIEPDGSQKENTYWRPVFNADPEEAKFTFDDWKQKLLVELRAAIDRRMVADVPVGCLLSGGLDSSLVVGMLAESGQRGLNTFSIGFESVGEEEGNEFKYSDIVAERFGTDHHKIEVNSQRALPNLDKAVHAMSEPMVSHDCIGFYLLSQEVAKHVKVVQSGQGADEVFAGYHWYPPMMQSVDPVGDYAKVFFDRDHDGYGEAVHESYLGEDHARRFVAEHFAAPGADRPIDKALRLDTTVMLVDDPVKRVDNMTMAWGLEARVPFLDHELVEFAGRIPAEMKVGPVTGKGKDLRGVGKHVLKEAAREVIPAEVIDRPKGYFPVPALKYLRGDYLDMVKDVLHAPEAKARGLFKPAYVEELLKHPEDHITPLRGSKLWQVALLEKWLQTHGV